MPHVMKNRFSIVALVAAASFAFAGCKAPESGSSATVGKPQPVVQPSVGLQERFGDEIVVAGHFYRIGTPVVTWMDPGGYDAYRVERRFEPYEESGWEATTQAMGAGKVKWESKNQQFSPMRYSMRYGSPQAATQRFTPRELEQVRGGGWPLPLLQKTIDQFVLHYDVAGTSRNCFDVLHDGRGLSVQFMLDLDGTIYQTLDVKERAWQATISNNRSIGIEIANIGSYGINSTQAPLEQWYKKDAEGKTYIAIPDRLGGLSSQRTNPSVLRPARNDAVVEEIQGVKQRMYDLTPQQYAALIKLTAALCDVFPKIRPDYPRDASGKLINHALSEKEWEQYQGVMGHYHVQKNKSDPGSAFQWDLVIDGARAELAARRGSPLAKK
jgi:N-acetylmuramoyl-L-alanine amidase